MCEEVKFIIYGISTKDVANRKIQATLVKNKIFNKPNSKVHGVKLQVVCVGQLKVVRFIS